MNGWREELGLLCMCMCTVVIGEFEMVVVVMC